jgi:hypothetical protein
MPMQIDKTIPAPFIKDERAEAPPREAQTEITLTFKLHGCAGSSPVAVTEQFLRDVKRDLGHYSGTDVLVDRVVHRITA